MSFTVRSKTAEDLGSLGSKLGGHGSVAIQSGSFISMAHSTLNGEGFSPITVEIPRKVATVQSGMLFNAPKAPR